VTTPLTFFELFAGVGGMSMGLEMAGWQCVGHAEIDQHPRAMLRHRWPDTRLEGDVAALTLAPGTCTLLTGGSPCQDLSVAGKRKGMTEGAGTRSSLFFEQMRLWQESDAPYCLWENVLGVFSSNKGADFAAVLTAFVGASVPVPADGWRSAGVASGPTGVTAWRVLDAQFFGVPHRRRRVFVLGARTGGVNPAEVLSLSESVRGDFAAGGEAGEGTPADTADGAGIGAVGCLPTFEVASPLSADADRGDQEQLVLAYQPHGQDSRVTPTPTLHARAGTGGGNVPLIVDKQSGNPELGGISPTLKTDLAHDTGPIVMSSGQANAEIVRDGSPSLTGLHEVPIVFAQNTRPEVTGTLSGLKSWGVQMATDEPIRSQAGRPRRLMPVECERLMGWPDRHTATGTDESGKTYQLSDSARYKACGNGIASPVVAWIAFRLRAAIEGTPDLFAAAVLTVSTPRVAAGCDAEGE
jgi:DNA (cytosine-5)-methyltransferase 1